MPKKSIEKQTVTELLDLAEKALNEDNDELFGQIDQELQQRNPFDFIFEELERLENLIKEADEENKKLKKIIRTHQHSGGKTLIEF